TGIGASTAMVARLGVARGGARRVAGLLAVPAPRHGTTATISQGDGPGRARRNATVPHLLAPDGAVPDAPPGALTMRGIAVRRGGQDVLRDLDLTIPGGAVVALVGRSGAGKSTLAELAGRLADPTEGSVSLDGTDLRALTRGTLREAVVYAFERPHLFGATPREAIGFGPAVPPDEDIRAAASAAQAAQFIERLPLGYDTPLDEAPLSGGEVQRLGLARAFAHASTARVLVFDDATSSLDTITEMLVSRAMTERLRGRTRLIVAHRAATAARADLAAWLDEGRIRAIAPHDKLWRDPDYRSLWCAPDGRT
ncbi:MAG: ABC transporter ATP-binding protein, partial [Nocardiopsaceae bacterium]|nr:ABC transporter ATP-binding protein [Nocardiopsaceae bacterium]